MISDKRIISWASRCGFGCWIDNGRIPLGAPVAHVRVWAKEEGTRLWVPSLLCAPGRAHGAQAPLNQLW